MKTYVVGADLGSTSAECVVTDGGSTIIASAVVDSGTFSQRGLARAMEEALDSAGITRDDVTTVVGTGYGRRLVPGGVDKMYTEVSAHARGVAEMVPGVRLVVDVGGQDTKAIVVDEHGFVVRFAMNDRCAGGTGRAYEGLAQTLETDLADLADLAMTGQPNLDVSSLCATFAVTEVISLLARGHDPADIAASVHKASAYRVLGLIGQVGKLSPIAVTGGVARNRAAIHYLEKLLRQPVLVPANPKITGAYGAALLAGDTLAGAQIPDSYHQPDPADDHKNRTMVTLTMPSGRTV